MEKVYDAKDYQKMKEEEAKNAKKKPTGGKDGSK